MAHFYVEASGGGKTVHRTGTKSSGAWAHMRGWRVGVECYCSYDPKTNKDTVEIWQTGGSSFRSGNRRILIATLVEEAEPIKPPPKSKSNIERAFAFDEANDESE